MMLLTAAWFSLLHWAYSAVFPRAFDGPKEILFYAGVPVLLLAGRRRLPPPRFGALLAVYSLIAVLSLGRASAIYEGVVALAKLVVWLGAAWWLSALNKNERENLRRFLVANGAVLAMLAVARIAGWFVAAPAAFNMLPPIGHSTYYASVMLYCLVLACPGLAKGKHPRERALSALAIVLLIFTLWLCESRACLLALAAAFLVALPGLPRKNVALAISAIGMFAIAAALLRNGVRQDGGMIARWRPLLSARSLHDLEAASSSRLATWRICTGLLRSNPMAAHGLGSFRFVYPAVAKGIPAPISLVDAQTWLMHPHNELLHQAIELGWLGALVFLLLFIGSFRATVLGRAGMAAIFGDWFLGTGFLSPLSRAYFAFFAGEATSPKGFCLPKAASLAAVLCCALVVLGYEMGELAVRHSQLAIAEKTAPRAFTTLFAGSQAEERGDHRHDGATDRLARAFPHVYWTKFQLARQARRRGEIALSENLLREVLLADPDFTLAQDLLQEWVSEH